MDDGIFETWRQQVFGPFCQTNTDEHRTIIERLDSLNGWRNRVLGAAAFVGVLIPAVAVAWAILHGA